MFNLSNPVELHGLVWRLAFLKEVPTDIVKAALHSITETMLRRVQLFEEVAAAFVDGVVGDETVEAKVVVVESVLALRLLATFLLRRLDGAAQVCEAFKLQRVDEVVDPFAQAVLMIDDRNLQSMLDAFELDRRDVDASRWWGRFLCPSWERLGVEVAATLDELADDQVVERMVEGGASETKARWCLELAEEALEWRYHRDLTRRQPNYLFEDPDNLDGRAVWIEQGSRPLEAAVRRLAERMAKTRTETLVAFATFLASQWSPSVEIPTELLRLP